MYEFGNTSLKTSYITCTIMRLMAVPLSEIELLCIWHIYRAPVYLTYIFILIFILKKHSTYMINGLNTYTLHRINIYCLSHIWIWQCIYTPTTNRFYVLAFHIWLCWCILSNEQILEWTLTAYHTYEYAIKNDLCTYALLISSAFHTRAWNRRRLH